MIHIGLYTEFFIVTFFNKIALLHVSFFDPTIG